ncbi:MAG: leucine-rich repeat domain-containing protein [Bacteroidales bacterium]|nr:leucine-rich repeat domain-containing protein [Bacteroidales bacterium]
MMNKFLPKRLKRAALLVLLLYAAGMTKSLAQSITVGDLNYSINADGETVTLMGHVDGQSATGGLTIPATVNHGGHTYTVTAIQESAFYGCGGLTGTLAIPNSVTYIGSQAFYYCEGLNPISFGNAVNYIGDNAFTYTGWYNNHEYGILYLCNWCIGYKEITPSGVLNIADGTLGIASGAFFDCSLQLALPNSLLYIGDDAFRKWYGNGLYGPLILPNSLIYIGERAFYNCENLSGELAIPNSMTYIGKEAFHGCSGFTGNLTIGNSVTYIGEWAFNNCSGFTGSLIIPNSVTYIGQDAFRDCSGFTGSLTISNSLETIEESTFYQCTGLTSISFGSSVTEIGSNAFSGCINLTALDIPEPVVTIGSGAFSNCTRLTSVTMGNSVTTIDANAFENCTSPLTVTLGNSVETIEANAFYGCTGLTSITIPSSVTYIGSNVFEGCIGLATLNYNATNSTFEPWGWYYYDWLEGCTSLTTVNIGETVEVIPDGFIKDCSTVTSVNFANPSSLVTIGNEAFYGCTGLTSIDLPNTITEIGQSAFESCSGLTSVTIPNSVVTIGWKAFANCTGMTALSIGTSVTTIESEAFQYCTSLTSATIPEAVENIGDYAFDGCSSLAEMNYNATDCYISGSDGQHWLTNCANLTTLTIGDNVESIPEYFAYNCSGLTSIVIPESVTTIAYFAFNACTGLTSMTIPSSVTNMGENAFLDCTGITTINYNATNCVFDYYYYYQSENPWLDGCSSLTTINIGDNVEVIPHRFAYNCEGLTAIEIPESVASIGYEAFYGCNGLETLTIPESVTSIEWGAFNNCTGLTTLNYNATDCSIEGEWLIDCPNLTNLSIGDNVESIPNYFVYNCTELIGELVIPEAVTYIGSNAFSNCSGLTSLTIGSAVEGIGYYAFGNCTGLTSITTLAETVPYESYSFGDVPTDITVYVPCGTLYEYENAWGWNYGFSFYQNPDCAYDIVVLANPEAGGVVTGAGVFYHGEDVTLTATPNEGYYFSYWAKDDQVVSYYPTYEFTAYQSGTYVANFERMSYQISASASPYEGGMVDGEGVYYHFDTCTLTAIPYEGYHVINWMKDGEVVGTGETYSFIVTENTYVVVSFQYAPEQTLANGWNWYSTYVELGGNNGLEQLENSLDSNGMVIKSRSNGFVEYYEASEQSGWFGTLNAIFNEQMYMVRTNTACSTAIVGEPTDVESHPITIGTGWNWIGFPSQQALVLGEALSDFTAANNDMFKGRNGYATYLEGFGWFGSLNILEPGQGYMYKSNSTYSKTLTYQTGRGEAVVANITPENNVFRPQSETFAQNMTVTAVIELDGSELRSEDYELAAFVNGECRGSVKLMYVEPIDRYIAFLTVFGEQEEHISFGLTDGTETSLSSTELDFVTDGTTGVLTQPFIVSFRGTTSIDEDGKTTVKVYPNPSNGIFHIEGQGIRKIEVFNGIGQAIMSEETCADSFQIDLGSQAKGMYTLRVITDDGVKVNQIVKY